MTNRPPIFIVGASRSGTTMLRLMLNAHPNIAVPNELGYFTSVPENWLQSWRQIPVSAHSYRQYIEAHLPSNRLLSEGSIDTVVLREKLLESAETRNLYVPYRLMLETYATAEGKERWGEKTPTNLFYCDVLLDMFPQGRFIHLVRDPRAVVRSANRFPRLPDDTVINAENWRHFIEKGYRRFADRVPQSQRCTIRYEDLTSEPKSIARHICGFIGEPFTERMLSFHEEARHYTPSTIGQLGGDRKVTRPVYRDKQTKWQTDLSRNDIGVIERICGDLMHEFGYEVTDATVRWDVFFAMTLKRAYVAFKHWQHRRDRFHIIRYPIPATNSNLFNKINRMVQMTQHSQ